MAETKTKEAPAVEVVKMTDGRDVEFPGKRKLQKESFVNEADGSIHVRLDFRNGETRTFSPLPTMVAKFAAHGIEQKLGDEIAGLEDVDDGVIAVDELIGRLNAGEWGVKRESSGLAGTSVLVRALVESTGKTADAIKAFLKDKTTEQKNALRNSDRLRPIVQRIETEKANKSKNKVDTEALFNEIS